jgi:hypothetical protein
MLGSEFHKHGSLKCWEVWFIKEKKLLEASSVNKGDEIARKRVP